MVLQIYMGAQPCTSKVKNDTKQNDKAFEAKKKKKKKKDTKQKDKAFEAKKKKKKKQVGSPYDLFMIII